MEWVLAFVSSPLRVRNSPSLSCSGTRKGTGATERTASASGKGGRQKSPLAAGRRGRRVEKMLTWQIPLASLNWLKLKLFSSVEVGNQETFLSMFPWLRFYPQSMHCWPRLPELSTKVILGLCPRLTSRCVCQKLPGPSLFKPRAFPVLFWH